MKTIGIILLGGKGSRFRGTVPKQFIEVNGKMICEYTLDAFENSEYIDEICISYIDGYEDIFNDLKEKYKKIKYMSIGGSERQYSVLNALSVIPANKDNIIVIHDGARPLVTEKELKNVVVSAKINGAVTTALPVTDTIKKATLGIVEETIDRNNLYSIKTPQAFTYEIILDAHNSANRDNILGTDDCSLVERLGRDVYIVDTDMYNIKITTEIDLVMFKVIIEGRK